MIKDLQNQHKCDIIRLELNYNKLLETQALSFHKKENESIESFKIISQDLEKTFKFCKNDFEETTMNFHEIKQAFLMSKTKHLSLLNEFDYDLKDSIKKIEEKQGNLPFKVKTLRNNEDSSKIEVNKSNIMKSFLTNINDSSMIDRKKLIALKDIMNKNQCKSKKAEKNLNESEIELEISVFLANQLNHSQEESRLNISMTKDEGKWDPALDSEKSEDSEYSELRKAFEIFDSLNLFESVVFFC